MSRLSYLIAPTRGVMRPYYPAMIRRGGTVLSVMIVLGGLIAGASGAQADTPAQFPNFTITMHSQPGDYVGQGLSYEFDNVDAALTGEASTTELDLSVSDQTDDFSFDIEPPTGSSLHTGGYYPLAQRTSFRAADDPGIDIDGDGRGCDTQSGSFEVRDLAAASSGQITRLDLLYVQHCEAGVSALTGEIRIGEPATSGAIVSDSAVQWPAVGAGGVGSEVPLMVRNAGAKPLAVGKPVLGPGGSDFPLGYNDCPAQLPAGNFCEVVLNFDPKGTAGPRSTDLLLPLDGIAHVLQLSGSVTPGVTSLVMSSQPGDYVGGGAAYSYTSATSLLYFAVSDDMVSADVTGPDDDFWDLDFEAPAQILVPGGVYSDTARYPFNGTSNGLDVTGEGRGCNTSTGSFAITQLQRSPVDGSLTHLVLTFVQHCEGDVPDLTGTLSYQAEKVTSPPAAPARVTSTGSFGGLRLGWVNPRSLDYGSTVVRIQPGDVPPATPFSGDRVFQGSATSLSLTGLTPGTSYALTLFTVDPYGNVSEGSSIVVRAGSLTLPRPVRRLRVPYRL